MTQREPHDAPWPDRDAIREELPSKRAPVPREPIGAESTAPSPETEASFESTVAELMASETAAPRTPRVEAALLELFAEGTLIEPPRAAQTEAALPGLAADLDREAPVPLERRISSRRRRVSARESAEPAGEPGRYSILGSIHRGGMGEILLARMHGGDGFSKKVVLKGLLARLGEDDVSYKLFLREAHVMAALEHPNLVRVFDFPHIGGKPYLAMEYVRGRNFHQVIYRSGAVLGGMPIGMALHVVAEAARGLHSAHHAKDPDGKPLGVVHRDVSPGNILVSFLGEVKVTDFGIAQIADGPRFTGPRSVRGKARYVAPEQIHGEPASVSSDVYSLGVVLSEAILGRPLWERGSIPETLLAIISEDRQHTVSRILADHPKVPRLAHALERALALSPSDRFPDALQLAEALESIAREIGAITTRVDLGHFVRRIFRDAPDLPADDGFSAPFLSAPSLAQGDEGEQDTNPTVITLEPGWAKASMRAGPEPLDSPPRAPSRGHEHPAHEPSLAPRSTLEGTPVERSASRARPASFDRPRPLPRPRSSLKPIEPPPVKIRAVALPSHAAVLEESLDEHSFSELLPGRPTDEEASGAVGEGMPAELTTAAGRPSRFPEPLARSPESAHLFIAGLFIGASLAVAGFLVALLILG